MRRSLRFVLLAVCLLDFQLIPSAQVNLNPLCEDDGVLAWGHFGDGRSAPAPVRSTCAGSVSVSGVSNAGGGDANQIAGFSAARGVVINPSVNWASPGPVTLTYPSPQVLDLKVWVLFKRSDCDFACIQTKMAYFLIWANERLSAERTGIQLAAFGGGTNWVEDQTATATGNPAIKALLDFSASRNDCKTVPSALSGLKQNNALNMYLIRTEAGVNYRGIYCSDARDMGFANAFVASQATNSTMLHEISHNLGLSHMAADLNVMNQAIDDGVFFSEGQIFRMNFSNHSAMNLTFMRRVSEMRDCEDTRPEKGCAAEATWIWPDP